MPVPVGHEAYQPQVRCYRDSVFVGESVAAWNRIFYEAIDCKGSKLGAADWRAKLIQEGAPRTPEKKDGTEQREYSGEYEEPTGRTLTRTLAKWYGEGIGQCDLRKTNVEVAIAVPFGSPCSDLLPQIEKSDKRKFYFSSIGKDGVKTIRGYWDGSATVCDR